MQRLFYHWGAFIVLTFIGLGSIASLWFLSQEKSEAVTEKNTAAKSPVSAVDQGAINSQGIDGIADQSNSDNRAAFIRPQRSTVDNISESWPDAEHLLEEVSKPDENGHYRRITILQPRDLPYKVRIEKKIGIDPVTGEEKILSENEMVADQVIIKLKPGQSEGAIADVISDLGGVLHHPFQDCDFMIVKLRDLKIEAVPNALEVLLSHRETLEYVEPDYIVRGAVLPDDPRFVDGSQWGLNNIGQKGGVDDADIDAPEGWEIKHDASDVIVAVIDSGTRYTHEDLAENMWVNTGEIPNDGIDNDGNGVKDDVFGLNSIEDTGDPNDDNGHGTLVAGIIGAIGDNGIGVTGIAWRTQLMALKFLSEDGNGVVSDAVECIHYGRRHGAQIMNASWSGGGFSLTLLNAIENTRNSGILFVTAAGNFSSDNDIVPLFPANYFLDNIVSVASTTRADNISGFSNFGESTVDIAAPGSAILTTFNRSNSDYVTRSGTSMATPYVSGVLALLKSNYPDEDYRTLINRLLAGGDKINETENKVRSSARLNLATSLNLDPIPELPEFTEPLRTQVAGENGSVVFRVEVKGDPPFIYSWSKDGQTIPGATQNFLIVDNIDVSKEGIYKVKVSNPFGKNSSSANLFVATVRPELALALDAREHTWHSVGFALWLSQPDVTRDGIDADASGLISDNLITQFQTTINGPGTASFWWRSSSEVLYDFLRFAIDGEQQISISGINDWSQEVISLTEGEHVLAWSYTKDGSLSIGDDRGYVDNFVFSPEDSIAPVIVSITENKVIPPGSNVGFKVVATGTPSLRYQWEKDGVRLAGETQTQLNLTEVSFSDSGIYRVEVSTPSASILSDAFNLTIQDSDNALSLALDNETTPWSSGGSNQWFNQSTVALDGVDALQSGNISDSETSFFNTAVTGPGVASFYWKVSSEAGNDVLSFFIDDTLQESISGNIDWKQVNFAVPAGAQILRWEYEKNDSISEGTDAGWVDQFQFQSTDPELPVIIRQPINTLSTEGDSVRFTVNASGQQPLNYKWRKDGFDLPGETGEELNLISVNSSDAGIFSVQIANDFGRVISDQVSLVVFKSGDPLGQALELFNPSLST